MKLDTYQLVSLAALLHDVGKIAHRAGIEIKNEFNVNEYCPENEIGKAVYKHAAYTAEFLDWFEREFGIETEKGDTDKNLTNIAAYHHKNGAGGALAEIIREADRLSSGFEREDRHESGKYNKDNLETIFSEISLKEEPPVSYYPLEKLNPEIAPIEESFGDNRENYRKLYLGFKDDLGKIPKNMNFDLFWDALEYLYEVYAWSVPSSSYKVYPRISLFDHSKTTAAIAQALYGYHEESSDLNIESIKDRSKDKFLLVQGDFSGIQNFIFSRMGNSNKFAAKILRARSFFVSLACDMVAYKICKNLGLTKASIVMSAGGKITLLLPNTPRSVETIYKVEKSINEEFHNLTFGETRFTLAFTSLNGRDFTGGRFSKKTSEVAAELEKRKLKPHVDEPVFDWYLREVKENGVCEICGKHPAKNSIKGTPVCKYCNKFKSIGEQLVKKKYLVIKTDKNNPDLLGELKVSFISSKDDFKNALLAFDLGKTGEFRGVAKSKIVGYVPKVLEEEISSGKYGGIEKEEDISAGDIKNFAMIAEDAKKPDQEGKFVGESFLGVLKADVDNLGKIFIEGIKGEVTISKVASLSRMIDFFFTGWLQHKIKKEFASIYTVFSGGDDLFLIGPFDQIINLALEIGNHLKVYTKNSDIHLSCGVYFVKPKVPVYQMARETEEKLEKAKNQGKNRISIFGRVLEWDTFNALMKDMEIGEILCDEEILSSSKKYSLFRFVEMAEKSGKKGGGRSRDLMWKPLLVYQLWRNIRHDSKREKAEIIGKLVGFIEKYRGDFVVPLSYYIYTTRRR